MLQRAAITSVGRYVPERVMTNADLEKFVETLPQCGRRRRGSEASVGVKRG
jgi:3-oxoacyl-[acyl-carrier-protein] synthase III